MLEGVVRGEGGKEEVKGEGGEFGGEETGEEVGEKEGVEGGEKRGGGRGEEMEKIPQILARQERLFSINFVYF